MNQNLEGGDINGACRGRALLDRMKDGQIDSRTWGEGVEAGEGLGLAFCPPQGLWVCALSPATLKAFLVLDPAQFLQQEGPATALHPRAPCPLVCISLTPPALESLPGGLRSCVPGGVQH